MMLWIFFAILLAATLAILLVPLTRARAHGPDRTLYDLTVYKDQLAEIDRDLERGVLNKDQAEAARTEIQRRILTTADKKGADKKGVATAPSRGRAFGAAAAITVTVPLLALGLYTVLGSPGLPDQPIAGRAGQAAQMEQQTAMIKRMVGQLQAKLEANPEDGAGWAMLGRSLRVMGQIEPAKDAYARAIKLMPDDANVRLELGGMLLNEVEQGSTLPPVFVALMKDVLRLVPGNPDALYFLGVAETQAGNNAKARDYWTRLVKALPEGPDRDEVQKQIDALK